MKPDMNPPNWRVEQFLGVAILFTTQQLLDWRRHHQSAYDVTGITQLRLHCLGINSDLLDFWRYIYFSKEKLT